MDLIAGLSPTQWISPGTLGLGVMGAFRGADRQTVTRKGRSQSTARRLCATKHGKRVREMASSRRTDRHRSQPVN